MARDRGIRVDIAATLMAVLVIAVVLAWIVSMGFERNTARDASKATLPHGATRAQLVSDQLEHTRSAEPHDSDETRQADESPGERKMGELRRRMVQRQIRSRGVTDDRVLKAMERVPRHSFVPKPLRDSAYDDRPLPIGLGQTISQPYIVALMTQLAHPKPTSRALDIGTGSGYQAAVLSELVQDVFSIEILKPLADAARSRLDKLGYKNVTVRCGDGYQGWPDKAPFDVIIVAAAPDHIPRPLIDQLAPQGHLIIPVGRFFQNLIVVSKRKDGTVEQKTVIPVAFVPMTGQAQKKSGL